MAGMMCRGQSAQDVKNATPRLSKAYAEGRIVSIESGGGGPNKFPTGTPEHEAFQLGLESYGGGGGLRPVDCVAERGDYSEG